MIAQARAEGLPLTVETCPHYLTFAAEEIPDGDPRFKCAPPIRERENRERLWAGPARRPDRHDRLGPLARAARAEAAGRRATCRAPGAGSPRSSSRCPAVWTEARAPRVHPGRPGAVDGPASRRSWSGCRAARERSPRAATPTSSSSTPRRPFGRGPVGPAPPPSGHAVRGPHPGRPRRGDLPPAAGRSIARAASPGRIGVERSGTRSQPPRRRSHEPGGDQRMDRR